jgi:hypothetical protein
MLTFVWGRYNPEGALTTGINYHFFIKAEVVTAL